MDSWVPKELKSLPPVAKGSITDALQLSIDQVAQPLQNLTNLHPALGKPQGGHRTICKTPMLYRMALRADNEVREWECNNLEPFDSAAIGSSALLSALWRNLQSEIAAWLGIHSGSIYNDYDKFFDRIDVLTLLTNAIKCGFPTVQLAFSLQQHLAPRLIQANGFSSQPIPIYKSILAGCKFSVAFTRALLKDPMKIIYLNHKNANCFVNCIVIFSYRLLTHQIACFT